MTDPDTRSHAAALVAQALDPAFFTACCNPVRLEIIRRLVEMDRTDIGDLATQFSQDRSVISRHLALLERADVVVSEKSGRHVFYSLNGPHIIARFETLLTAMKALGEVCCPPTGRTRDDPR